MFTRILCVLIEKIESIQMKKLILFFLISFLIVACSKEETASTDLDQEIAQKLATAKTDDIIAYINGDNTPSMTINPSTVQYIKYKGKSPEGYTSLQFFYQNENTKGSDPFYVTDAQKFITLPQNNEKYIEGKLIIWSENGHKLIENNFINGLQEGVNIAWYENGHKMLEEHYINGKKEGLLTAWYENGQKSVEVHFVNGLENGPSTNWYENGQKQFEVQYKDGQLAGIVKKWNKDGTQLPPKAVPDQKKLDK